MSSSNLEREIWDLLKEVKFPGMSRDIVSFGFVDRVKVTGDVVAVHLMITTGNASAADEVRREVESVVERHPGVAKVAVGLEVNRPPTPGEATQRGVAQDASLVPGVKHIVAVASGKGGVGKSTVAANLAVKLGQLGHAVGLLDADIYGPSQPMMFGISGKPEVDDNRLKPFEKHGIRVMSLGFVLDVDTPVIWRGPMVMKAIEQLLGDVDWGELDFLIVDLPPGTGDAQLTISQRVPLSGAVIVTTPQDIALIDARKGLAMFRKVSVPVIGIVENMSSFVCPHCGEETEIFKRGGGEKTADLLGCPYLGAIPLDAAIVAGGDAGVPIVVSEDEGPHATAFTGVAQAVVAEAGKPQAPRLSIV